MTKTRKIKGLKAAVGNYQRYNSGGEYDSHYGYMMFDLRNGELWTDEFFSIGHNSWIEYHSPYVICVSRQMKNIGYTYNDFKMKTVKDFILNNWDQLEKEVDERIEYRSTPLE